MLEKVCPISWRTLDWLLAVIFPAIGGRSHLETVLVKVNLHEECDSLVLIELDVQLVCD
jgi:hypothetical protein